LRLRVANQDRRRGNGEDAEREDCERQTALLDYLRFSSPLAIAQAAALQANGSCG
jgi:hypothetical protein